MRRWRKTRPRRRTGWAVRVIALLVLLGVIFLFLDWKLRPIVAPMVTNQARIVFVDATNDAVMQELTEDAVTYTDLVNIERGDSGQILAVTTDMAQMNQLKASILQRVQARLGGHMDTGVPLGTLLGSELLHGRGPNVPVRLTLSGNVTAEFESTFESAGINQTKHRICLRIHTSIYSYLPPAFNGTTEVETDVPIAETVIIGEVPQLMANFK